MTKAKMLAYLHHIEPDHPISVPAGDNLVPAGGTDNKDNTEDTPAGDNTIPGLTAKEQQDMVGTVLNLEEVRGDTITDCLRVLLEDDIPCRLFMRTAIISSQKHSDVRSFVLAVVIPTLIRRKVWSLPKAQKVLWDGVCHAVKLLAAHRSAEPTLRAVLALPGAQLKEMVVVAKEPLKKFLQLLSVEEREEVVSGRWAGLEGEQGQGGKDKLKRDILTSLDA